MFIYDIFMHFNIQLWLIIILSLVRFVIKKVSYINAKLAPHCYKLLYNINIVVIVAYSYVQNKRIARQTEMQTA